MHRAARLLRPTVQCRAFAATVCCDLCDRRGGPSPWPAFWVNQVLLGTLAYTIRHDPAPFFPSEPVMGIYCLARGFQGEGAARRMRQRISHSNPFGGGGGISRAAKRTVAITPQNTITPQNLGQDVAKLPGTAGQNTENEETFLGPCL